MTSQRFSSLSVALWIVVSAIAVMVAAIALFDLHSAEIVGTLALLWGLVLLGHGIYRLTHPGWLESEWWQQRPVLAHVLGTGTTLFSGRGLLGKVTEVFSALLQVVAGLFVLLWAGVVLL